MKKIAILGSTGSIGQNALQVVRNLSSEIKVVALAAHENIELIEAQAREFNPEIVVLYNKAKALELQRRLPHLKVSAGLEGLEEAASWPNADLVLSALSGSIGIAPTIAAIQSGKTIALANKEVLVAAGDYIMKLAKKKGVLIIPVDSEHNALYQCLVKEKISQLHRLIITASGGPFLYTPTEELKCVDYKAALRHPTYKMGSKITIDSSTLMNKGLEVIEAHFLFGVSVDKIEVVVHPQSIIHSMIEMIDGSILAQLSNPNMQLPIQYAFTYPERQPTALPYFDFTKQHALEFIPPDTSKFPCLSMAFEALRAGGSAPCYLNAANEVLVQRFLKGGIGWMDISCKLQQMMNRHKPEELTHLEKILFIDAAAREEATLI